MQNSINNTLAYTSSTLLNAYKAKRNELLPILKEEKDEEKLKKVHLALLSIDLVIQIFNDANRSFPVINKEIVEHANSEIPLLKNQTSAIKKLKQSLEFFNKKENIIFEKKMYYSIELSNSSSKEIPSQIASNILKESSFLFTHVLHVLYEGDDQLKVFDTITAHLKYILGLNIIEPISAGRETYKEMLQEREEYKTSEEMNEVIDSFIFNAHHFCLTTLLFVKHWMGYKEYGLEKAEEELNDKINEILKQRKNTPTPA